MSRADIARAIVNKIRSLYHGSPHKFDRFDASKIGTGEGAQAYGIGTYLAENEGVARGYRDRLAGDNPTQVMLGDQVYNSIGDKRPLIEALRAQGLDADTAALTASHLAESGGDLTSALGIRWNADVLPPQTERVVQALEMLKPAPAKGHMYEVDINADPAHFLDWDKPLSQQPQALQELVASGPPRLSGNDVVRGRLTSPSGEAIYRRLGSGTEASQALREAGIPGIRYPQGFLSGVGDGTSNYVIFDPNIIDIKRRYAFAPGLGLGSLMQQPEPQPPPPPVPMGALAGYGGLQP